MNILYEDTIVALSTPQGSGAIGVIRLSGKDAISITEKVFLGKSLIEKKSHTLQYGNIYDSKDNSIIDEVVVAIYRSPNSYTKEDVIEISCHGSPYIVNYIISLLLQEGARLATAGEFTQRAYINGRFDLSQAEAVADLIASESESAHKIALSQLKGGISGKLKELRSLLIHFTALLELELDFTDEDVEFADRSQLLELLLNIKNEVTILIESFKYGNAIKNGIPVTIIGKPNAGKSTLLNSILREDRAIVSNIAGTTRDTIEEVVTIKGIQFRFIDTAGIRETTDEIEQIGVERTFSKIQQAQIAILLFDVALESIEDTIITLQKISRNDLHIIVCPNKVDLIKENSGIASILKQLDSYLVVPLSAKAGYNITQLEEALLNYINNIKTSSYNVIISNQRHHHALQQARKIIDEILLSIKRQSHTEFIAQDIKIVLKHLASITGDVDIDKDILGAIFSRFCIGK